MRKRLLVAVGAVALPLLAIAGFAMAGGQSSLAEARNATAPFHDLAHRQAAGYTVELHDVTRSGVHRRPEHPERGAMGVHMVNMALLDDPTTAAPLDDTTLDPTRPRSWSTSVATTAPQARRPGVRGVPGGLEERARGQHGPPTLFGVPFDSNTARPCYDLPPFYALHAWIWKPNPTDIVLRLEPEGQLQLRSEVRDEKDRHPLRVHGRGGRLHRPRDGRAARTPSRHVHDRRAARPRRSPHSWPPAGWRLPSTRPTSPSPRRTATGSSRA